VVGKKRVIYTFGKNQYGELGNGTNIDSYFPVNTLLLGNIIQLSSGSHHCMALVETSLGNRTIYAWGLNENGQLGIGSTTNVNIPTEVLLLGQSKILQIACGNYFSMALVENSSGTRNIYAWGLNQNGQLGIASLVDCLVPSPVIDIDGSVIQICCGENVSLALMEVSNEKRYIYYWGLDFFGKLVITNGDEFFVENIIQIFCSRDNIGYAVLGDGFVYSWNFNGNEYQLIPLNNIPIPFEMVSNSFLIQNDNSVDIYYENKCDKLIPYCRNKMTMMYKLKETGGNNPKISSKQKYSQYVRNFRH
jgi:alpha-tubulin suppressor-like RCC1 family protein